VGKTFQLYQGNNYNCGWSILEEIFHFLLSTCGRSKKGTKLFFGNWMYTLEMVFTSTLYLRFYKECIRKAHSADCNIIDCVHAGTWNRVTKYTSSGLHGRKEHRSVTQLPLPATSSNFQQKPSEDWIYCPKSACENCLFTIAYCKTMTVLYSRRNADQDHILHTRILGLHDLSGTQVRSSPVHQKLLWCLGNFGSHFYVQEI
jgi:hypothetical protein